MHGNAARTSVNILENPFLPCKLRKDYERRLGVFSPVNYILCFKANLPVKFAIIQLSVKS